MPLITKSLLRTLSGENIYCTPDNLPLTLQNTFFAFLPFHSPTMNSRIVQVLTGNYHMKYKSKIYYILMVPLFLLAIENCKKKKKKKSYYWIQKLKNFTLPSMALLKPLKQVFLSRRVGKNIDFSTWNKDPNSRPGWLTLTKSLNLRTCFLVTLSEVFPSSEIPLQRAGIILL